VVDLLAEGYSVAHAHLRYLRPFPRNLGQIINNYERVLIPEINNGQLIKIIRDQFLVDAKPFHKVMGVPITKTELLMKVKEMFGLNN
jgi:2-oxoglutarate ferredoxin oxidoreductase subunit alpha